MTSTSVANNPSSTLDLAALTLGDGQQRLIPSPNEQHPDDTHVMSTSSGDRSNNNSNNSNNSARSSSSSSTPQPWPPRTSPSETNYHAVVSCPITEPRDRPQLCKYKSGRCRNERVVKRNGELHTLCEFHRHRQNELQRKSDRKQRAAARQRRLQNRVSTIPSNLSPCLIAATPMSPLSLPIPIVASSPPLPTVSNATALRASPAANNRTLHRFKFALGPMDPNGLQVTGLPARQEPHVGLENHTSTVHQHRLTPHCVTSKGTDMKQQSSSSSAVLSAERKLHEQSQCCHLTPLPSIYTLLEKKSA